jgi:hypothetical protein
MGGVYGEINSRADFHRVLNHATAIAKRLLATNPHDPTIGAIDRQLEAIKQWTMNGRDPTVAERKSLDMGLRATRELSDTGDPTIDEFTDQVQTLHNYVEDWPTDDQAARATDEDFFDDDGADE